MLDRGKVTNMIYTLTDARNKVAPYVQSGTTNTAVLDARINDALERLLDNADWACLQRQVRILVVGNTFALPYNAEKILWCDIDGTPARVFGQSYQYVSSGPGDSEYRSVGFGLRDLIDLGDHWPVAYEIPRTFIKADDSLWTTGEMYLVAFASAAADVGKLLDVIGTGVDGLPRLSGESIPIQSRGAIAEGVWDAGFTKSAKQYSSIDRIVKPATAGYVALYAVDPDTGSMFQLANYHPSQTTPQFRRYRVTKAVAADSGVQSASVNTNLGLHVDILPEPATGSRAVVLASVRLRHIPLSDPGDLVPLDSLQALLLAVRAINAEAEKDFALADVLMGKATDILSRREEANTQTKGTPAILDLGHRTSLGRRMNRNMIL